MRESWRALIVAVGYLSQAAALAVGSVIATWTFSLAMILGVITLPGLFNDWAISVLTLAIDLVLIMVAGITNRTAARQLAVLQRQTEQATAHAASMQTALAAVETRLGRIEGRLERITALLDRLVSVQDRPPRPAKRAR